MVNPEFGGDIYYWHGTSEARKLCILIKTDIEIELKEVLQDTDGRNMQQDCIMQEKSVTISNVYDPNKDDPDLFYWITKKDRTVWYRPQDNRSGF